MFDTAKGDLRRNLRDSEGSELQLPGFLLQASLEVGDR